MWNGVLKNTGAVKKKTHRLLNPILSKLQNLNQGPEVVKGLAVFFLKEMINTEHR